MSDGPGIVTGDPQDIGELSRARLAGALRRLERAVQSDPRGTDPLMLNEIRVIRLVLGFDQRLRWYGAIVDPDDSSVTAGVMMRNAFEAVGDQIDEPPAKWKHWLTRMYGPLWHRGRREYRDYLDTLMRYPGADREIMRKAARGDRIARAHDRISDIVPCGLDSQQRGRLADVLAQVWDDGCSYGGQPPQP
jgi:hypothetical protein